MFGIGSVATFLEEGQIVRRSCWGAGEWIVLINGGLDVMRAKADMARTHLLGRHCPAWIGLWNGRAFSPWAPSSEDIFATDYQVVRS